MHLRTAFGRSVGVALGLLYLADSALSISSGGEGRWEGKRAKDPCAEIASSWNSGSLL